MIFFYFDKDKSHKGDGDFLCLAFKHHIKTVLGFRSKTGHLRGENANDLLTYMVPVSSLLGHYELSVEW